MTRILWLTETYFPQSGGMAQSCDRIVYGLRRSGLRVDLAILSRRAATLTIEQQLEGLNISVPLSDSLPFTLNRMWTQVEKLHRIQPYTQIVAFGGTGPLIAGPLFSAWLSTPLISCIRGNDFDQNIFSPVKRGILDTAFKASALVCTVTAEKQKRIRQLFPDTPVVHIANGVDLENWQALPSDRDRAKIFRFAYGNRPLVLGVFGHLKQKKGIEHFLASLSRMEAAVNIQLVLAGQLEFDLSPYAPLQFTVLPFQDRYELIPLYLSCDYVVLPSFYDGLPNVLLEAAALSVPCLGAAVGGIQEFLADFPELLFEPESRSECQAVIQAALSRSKAEVAGIGNALQQLVKKRYSLSTELERYRRIFEAREASVLGEQHL